MAKQLQKNDFVTVEITDLTKRGEGVGRAGNLPLFVKDALPGDTVRARITRPKKTYAFAKTEEILTASPDRIMAPCPEARRCGGCTLQALTYETQCVYKENFVRQDLQRIGGFADEAIHLHPILEAKEPLRYRNKAQYPIGLQSTGAADGRTELCVGYYAARTHSLIPVQDCLLSPAHHSSILRAILDFGNTYRWRAYDENTGRGRLRHILIRDAFASGEIMVCLVINGRHLPGEERLPQVLRELKDVGGRITSVCKNSNTEKTNVILGEEVLPLYGKPYIEDILLGHRFSISAQSFYQVNHAQTERLYGVVRGFAGLTGGEELLDLFCGIGTISLFLASQARHVSGIEINPRAVQDAKENARVNDIANADFFAGAAEDLILSDEIQRPDVVVLDPPRKGCDAKLLQALRQLKPARIVYVSCDSATLARDLKILCAGGAYEIKATQPVDLFPQTCHTECVVRLDKK